MREMAAAGEDREANGSSVGGEYVVFGSSIGWLAFYGACHYGVPTAGVEIMPYLVQVSNEAAATLGVKRIRFSNQDMLQSNLSQAKVVMLTSQCWDDQLIERVHAKLAEELPFGGLVVDYRGGLAEAHPEAFEVTEKVVAPVSWNPQQPFFVMRRR